MKKIVSSKRYIFTILSSVLIFCFNGSVMDTGSAKDSTVDVNFQGTIEDHRRTADVQFILIGGKYENIPVYQVPQKSKMDSAIDPKQNKILLDLNEIDSIALKHPESPSQSEITVNNRKYVHIVVAYPHGTKKEFIVESSRRVKCQEANENKAAATSYEDRDLSFSHIKKLTIKGFKKTSSKEVDVKLEKQKNVFKENTQNIIDKIEDNVKNLPMDNPNTFEKMKDTILSLLKSLRDQLQKFLDMVK